MEYSKKAVLIWCSNIKQDFLVTSYAKKLRELTKLLQINIVKDGAPMWMSIKSNIINLWYFGIRSARNYGLIIEFILNYNLQHCTLKNEKHKKGRIYSLPRNWQK